MIERTIDCHFAEEKFVGASDRRRHLSEFRGLVAVQISFQSQNISERYKCPGCGCGRPGKPHPCGQRGRYAPCRTAVRCGGGKNHRDTLASAVLIKDNHVASCGGVRAAIERARARAPHTSRVECEVDSLAGLDEAIAAGADVVLLDNMGDADVRTAVARASGKAILEASGGITFERIAALSAIGVDCISVGALTHSVRSADIGLDFV